MLEMELISEERFLEASQDLVVFRQGSFRYQDNHQIEVVRQQMNEEPFHSILQDYGAEGWRRESSAFRRRLIPISNILRSLSCGDISLAWNFSAMAMLLQSRIQSHPHCNLNPETSTLAELRRCCWR